MSAPCASRRKSSPPSDRSTSTSSTSGSSHCLPQRFDLVVATNILVYYDTFEQCLALANVARMTAVGGLFLSNSSALELPGSTLRSVGYKTVVFSDRPDDGEHVIFYRRLPDPAGR